ncbi:MAG TPA: hypothetical protein VHO25_24725 [Polyangiaceae bacterium]|nr:hypothetical protein [Polyangiaceae bacterium]
MTLCNSNECNANEPILEALRRIQLELERLYELEPGPDIVEFVHFDEAQRHETVLLRETAPDVVEMLVVLPADATLFTSLQADSLSDARLQLIEGVSHFVLLIERARIELPATQLELEIQAEVDKFALLASSLNLEGTRSRDLHQWLFEDAHFLHSPDTEAGQRYRHANEVAARLCARLDLVRNVPTSQALLRRFYRCGQTEKLSLALAA